MDADFYSDEITDHARKTITQKYNIKTKLNVTVKTDIKSLRFEPSSINLYSEDVKTTDDDGRVYYDFDRRYHGKDESGYDEYGCWVNGDKLFVAYKDGNSRVFIYNAEEGFVSNDGYDAYPEVENWALKEGNNYVRIWYRGAYCTLKVFLDSPAQRAARAKAAREAAKAAASNINKATVSAADIKKASDLGATSVTLGASVKKIQKNAFKGTNITYVEVKTKKLKAKSVKGSLKGSKVSTIKVNIGKKKVNKQYVKKYKKIFTKKNAGKKAKVK